SRRHPQHLAAELLYRLLPLDPGPFSIDQLQRVFEPPFAGHEFAHRGTFGAMRAAIDRAVPARLLTDPHTVGDLRGHRAPDRAMGADALAGHDIRTRRGRRPSLGLADAAERQGPDGCKPAGGHSRAA